MREKAADIKKRMPADVFTDVAEVLEMNEAEKKAADLIAEYLDGDTEAIKHLEKMCENAERFRWHDLRKNPDDLPAQNHTVVFATTDGSSQEGELYYNTWIQFRWNTTRSKSEVIAWKEIEHFYGE